ncbi:hypothetical protein [Pseudomonas syringae]|uniref:hypothetical protein n=1 Tax=Pseudomonas syringae TaxID=317 RepID=UPI0011AEEA6B|nr:hypothetical protein [Pseudomonas syringae]
MSRKSWKKFSFLSGSLAIENRPFHFQVADVIKKALVNHTGYLGYELNTLGAASDADVPSFIVVSQQPGIILIDVVEGQVLDVIETDSEEYWKLESGNIVTSKSPERGAGGSLRVTKVHGARHR